MQIKPNLDQLGVPLIVVGNGSKRFAQKFKEGIKFNGEIYLDPESKSFKALGLPRLSAWQAVKRFFFDSKAVKFFKGLKKTYRNADLEGDGQQTGGVFVVGPGIGRPMRYVFREHENDTETFADLDAILEASGWTKGMTLTSSSTSDSSSSTTSTSTSSS